MAAIIQMGTTSRNASRDEVRRNPANFQSRVAPATANIPSRLVARSKFAPYVFQASV
jgi:hypothetical protein